MKKSIAVLTENKSVVFDAIKDYFKDKDIEVFETTSILEAADADLCLLDGYKGSLNPEIIQCGCFLKLHESLLPSFDCDNPAKAAFEYGVKVSGVTINYLNEDGTNGRIIAQYPVFLDIMTSFEDFQKEMKNVACKLVPFVLNSVIENVLFSYDMLMDQKGCNGGCNGACSGQQ